MAGNLDYGAAMRVLIDAVFAPGDPRGVGRYVIGLCAALGQHADITPVVVYGAWHETFFAPLRSAGAECIAISAGRRVIRRHAWHLLGLPRLARRISADVIHITDRSAPPVWPGLPTVSTIHDVLELDRPEAFTAARLRYRRWVLGRQLAGAGQLVAVSQFTAARIVTTKPESAGRITVALNGPGLDPAIVAVRPPVPHLPPFLIHVGAQQRHKNLPRLVRAFRRLADEDAYLLLVGSDHNDTQEVARASAGDARVIRLRSITDPQLAWLYEHAVGLVFPSLYEGFGMPVLDAMTRGCPVITSDRSALPEVVGEAALMVDPLDEAALESAIRRLLGDPALRGRNIEAGRRRAAQLTWAAAAEATAGAYASAITER